jgi:hypothetical protein
LEFVDDCSTEDNPTRWTFEQRRVFGWSMHIECLVPAGRRSELVAGLGQELSYVNELLPQAALDDLWNINIWAYATEPSGNDGTYIPPMKKIPRYPEGSEGGIHIDAVRLKLNDPNEPAFILHEIAHAWDHRVYNPRSSFVHIDGQYSSRGGPGTNQVIDAYLNARESGLYDGTDGSNTYNVKNADEYFACLTESLLWRGVSFPFEKSELLEYDPLGAAAVEAAWNVIP